MVAPLNIRCSLFDILLQDPNNKVIITIGTITLDISVTYSQITQAILGKSHLPADGTSYLAYPPLMTKSIGVPDFHRGL
jgi:hypothetical protein